jgi:hypothetical protein
MHGHAGVEYISRSTSQGRLCANGCRTMTMTLYIPQVKGIEIYATRVNEDGTMNSEARPINRFTVDGHTQWSQARFCPRDNIAVGLQTYFSDTGGFTGIALQCKGIEGH